MLNENIWQSIISNSTRASQSDTTSFQRQSTRITDSGLLACVSLGVMVKSDDDSKRDNSAHEDGSKGRKRCSNLRFLASRPLSLRL